MCSCLVILLHVLLLHKLFALAADVTMMYKCDLQVLLHRM